MYLILIAIAWLYVALMMAVAEATSPIGSVLGAIFTFLLYGVGPVALVLYILSTPTRRRARKQAEASSLAPTGADPSDPPNTSGESTTDPVPPVREKL
jgi:hypothetical protein